MSTTTTMARRRFGRTELPMPVFSCGGMRYQQDWKDQGQGVSDESQANLERTIQRALDSGINHIETARGYGTSERQLGRILPGYDRDALIVQTKISPKDDPAKFTEEFEDSLGRLQLDYVDLLGIHGINNTQTLDWSIRPGGCFEAAQKLRERGLVRFVGFSTHGPTDVIVDAIHHGSPGTGNSFDYVNLHWYWILQRNWPAIEAATARDMGVFIISPTDKGGRLYEPPQKLVDLCRPLHPITFNDLFCLSHDPVHTLSIGAARPSDFDEHLDALPLLDRAGEVIAPILERLSAALAEAVPAEQRDPHHAGLPNWDDTPGGMNLPTSFWLLNLARAFDMHAFGKYRYNMMGNGGHWMPGYKADKLDEDGVEAQLRQQLADHPWGADTIVELLRETHDLLKGEEGKRLSSA